ncbi:ArsR/SmtB family transcription factor [Paracoccus laeviglucosivorans]|uniref:Transcriptional regulator, ArsR family n=1 Tax=Paracoccus laeviglucosivorans TaxID=1197861 RepID=A0A521F0A7_9RHOB|nr:metalloregulator ArsR/SmtB family transcription factor [Paracoccus laeviglucosivorans]SMO89557.1 transcriptional regulator, ArsR family [Paracoccus laeviglucosivorans]
MDEIFQALSDATRRRMLRDLAQGERTITELAGPHGMSLVAASKHVKVLEKAGLLRREIRWRSHVCHLQAEPLAQAHREIAYYERFWTDALGRLDQLLRDEDANTSSDKGETT